MKILQNKYIRYLSGFFYLLIILFCFWHSKLLLLLVSFVFIFFSLKEYDSMFKNRNIHIHKICACLISFILSYIFIYRVNDFYKLCIMLLLMGFIVPFILTVVKNRKPYIETIFSTTSFIMFVFSGLFIIKLQSIQHDSLNILLAYCLCILISDYVASVLGQKFKNPIFFVQEISPKKTLNGAFFHMLSSCFFMGIISNAINLSPFRGIILGFLISLSAQFGDLALSCIKRELNIKHSSNLFLEYGGIFDRIDAFIFSAHLTYYYLEYMY